MFIVFDGIEGCGKSTQARLLARRLAERGVPSKLTREPGGTPLGESIRGLLLHGEHMGAASELLLMLAARAAHVRDVVQPALAAGEIVVCDRYQLSTFAYQGIGRGLGLERVKPLNEFATGGLNPDLTFVLDVPWEVATERRSRSRGGEDRIERAGPEFHRKVAEAYRLLATQEPGVVLLDGQPAAEVVHSEILQVLRQRFPETLAVLAG